MADKNLNRYSRLIEEIFFKYYQPGIAEVPFERKDIETAAAKSALFKLDKIMPFVRRNFLI